MALPFHARLTSTAFLSFHRPSFDSFISLSSSSTSRASCRINGDFPDVPSFSPCTKASQVWWNHWLTSPDVHSPLPPSEPYFYLGQQESLDLSKGSPRVRTKLSLSSRCQDTSMPLSPPPQPPSQGPLPTKLLERALMQNTSVPSRVLSLSAPQTAKTVHSSDTWAPQLGHQGSKSLT